MRTKLSSVCGGLCFAIMSIQAAGAQQIATSGFYKAADHDQRVKITSFTSLDPGCRSLGTTRINLIREPQGGTIETSLGHDFASGSGRVKCRQRKVPATILYYHAGSSFTGIDTFDVEAAFPDGFARKYRYAIVVR